MKINIDVEIKEFNVPDYVHIVSKLKDEDRTKIIDCALLPIGDLSEEALESLCNTFRDEVFLKAGKERSTKA